MIIEHFKKRIDFVLTQFVTKNKSRLPFQGYYAGRLKTFLVDNIEKVAGEWAKANESGNVTKFIDWLVDFAKANSLGIPFPASLFTGIALEALRKFLHANKDLFADKIGTT